LKETPLLQRFPRITVSLIIARSTSLTTDTGAQTAVARTLSRELWQQKNFRGHRLRLRTPLANGGFSLESNKADSGRHAPPTFHIVHHRKRSRTGACVHDAAFGARRATTMPANSDAEF
jgi:hypothetical protein